MSKYLKFNPCPFCGKTDLGLMPKYMYEELVEENGTACVSLRCRTCDVDMYEHTDGVTYEDKVKLLARKWNRAEAEE